MFLTSNAKVTALETLLCQSVENFKDLIVDIKQLQIESQDYKQQYETAKGNCENKTCMGADELRKVIAAKDQVIQSIASILTKLNETKNFDLLIDAFKILFEDVAPLTPPTDESSPKTRPSLNSNKIDSPVYENDDLREVSITEDVSFKEQSACEIEGTPTGRTSPILHMRKTKSVFAKSDFRDKKKCPNDWPTSDPKAAKLYCTPTKSTPTKGTPKGSGKLRQSRLHLVKMNTTAVVDLTCSPEVVQNNEQYTGHVQPLIKKESAEYDDTILPSPTSEPGSFTLLKTISKASPNKFKKPKGLSLKFRCENVKRDENRDASNTTSADMEESINILNQQFANRLREIKKENTIHKSSSITKDNDIPVKKERISPAKKETDKVQKEINAVKNECNAINMEVADDDVTNASISLSEHVERTEEENRNVQYSPSKHPLAENINITNTPPKHETESSMSILRSDGNNKTSAMETVKRKLPHLVEPVYKEPTVRKKADKRNLQGWSCEECMNFYGVLYKDDPVMLAKKINECSKHRGRHNPARPKTPPNFWNPRWTVPDDTEELNRMNNAD